MGRNWSQGGTEYILVPVFMPIQEIPSILARIEQNGINILARIEQNGINNIDAYMFKVCNFFKGLGVVYIKFLGRFFFFFHK